MSNGIMPNGVCDSSDFALGVTFKSSQSWSAVKRRYQKNPFEINFRYQKKFWKSGKNIVEHKKGAVSIENKN